VQVYERGVPASAGVTVTMSDMNATQANGVSLKTNSAGQVSFPLQSTTSEIIGWVFQTGENPTLPVGNAFTPLNFTYTYQRVLPAESDIAQLPPSWSNAYTYVLANWESMAPCMDNWLRLGDEQQVRSYASVIKTLTDPVNFENFRFMPVTRDMSNGQRTLLYNFLNSPYDATTSDSGAATSTANTASSARRSSAEKALPLTPIHQLSRAMRSGPTSD